MADPIDLKPTYLDGLDNRERSRAVFEQPAVGMALVALEGRWLWVNQKLQTMLGYSNEEMLGLTFQDLTHPDDLPSELACIERLLAGEIANYSLEKRYVRKNRSHL